MCAFLWIAFYVYSEWSYDRHYRGAEDIYRVTMTWQSEGDFAETHLSWSLSALPDQLRSSFPEVEAATGLSLIKEAKVNVNNNLFLERAFYEADTCYFRVFYHRWLAGNPAHINLASVVLTESLAYKYFGHDAAVGNTIEINQEPYVVAGVISDLPINSSLHFQALTFTFNSTSTDWGFTFLRRQKQASMSFIRDKLDSLFHSEYNDILKQSNTVGAYHLEPLTAIHLGEYKMMDAPKANKLMLLTLLSIGAVILAISIINYTNLTTTFAEARKKEAVIRNTLGALAKDSRVADFIEATWLGLIAVLLSSIIIYVCWPLLNEFVLLDYSFRVSHLVIITAGLVILILTVALLLSIWIHRQRYRNHVADILRQYSQYTGQKMTRAVLITFQFSVSLLLAYSAQVMVKQLNFVSDRVVDQNQTLVIDLPLEEDVYPLLKKFDASLKQLSFVNQSAFIGPGAIPASKPEMDIFKVDVNGGSAIQTLKYVEVDPNYFHVLGFQLLAGRLFTDDEPGDWSAVIVDERYVKQQGWKDDPLQHKICYGGNACKGLHILGVVRHEGIGGLPQKENPLLYYPLNKQPEKLIVKLSAINHEKLEQIKTRWGDIVQRPIQYQFLDHYIGLQLERERKVEQQVYLFSATAVLLIAAGLFGMIHGHLSRKKRETAIRKVFGAPIKDLLQLSWTRHVLLFVVSLSLAYPLSYIILQDWLGNFPSKVDVGFMAFIQIAFMHLAILLMAISYHAWQLTRAKPINVIRHE